MLAGVQVVSSGERRLKSPAIFVLVDLCLTPADDDFSVAEQHIPGVSFKGLKNA